jgi:hypothetical protein
MSKRIKEMRLVGLILLVIGTLQLFNQARQGYESLIWLGLGLALIARFDPAENIKFKLFRKFVLWAGVIISIVALIIQILTYFAQILQTTV